MKEAPKYMSQILKDNMASMVEEYMKSHQPLQFFLKTKIREAYASALRDAQMLILVCEKETEERMKGEK